MRIFIALFSILIIATNCFASYYIVNDNNDVVGKTSFIPSESDLSARGEDAIWSDDDIPLDQAEYRAGKIVQKKETQAQKNQKAKEAKRQQELMKVNKRALKMAYEQLKSEGEPFDEIDYTDFE